MYRAKEFGHNKYEFYTASINESSLRRLKLESSLRKAIGDQTGLSLVYQPVVNLETNRIDGTEALLRFKDQELGMIFPSELIRIAEETGMIIPLGEWVLRTACAQNLAWRREGFPSLYVSVNLSAWQLQQAGFLDILRRILRETGSDPRHLQLEITESAIILHEEAAISKLGEIQQMGIRIAIDDFGTGYSSLGRLKNFPIDMLKIDKSFVYHIPADISDTAIVQAIIDMAHSLKLETVAEGVETYEQAAFLREHGCSKMQGYLFSHPISVEEMENSVAPGRPIGARAIR